MQFKVNFLLVNYIHLIIQCVFLHLCFFCKFLYKKVGQRSYYIYLYMELYSELLISECNNSAFHIPEDIQADSIDIQVILEMVGKFALRQQTWKVNSNSNAAAFLNIGFPQMSYHFILPPLLPFYSQHLISNHLIFLISNILQHLPCPLCKFQYIEAYLR